MSIFRSIDYTWTMLNNFDHDSSVTPIIDFLRTTFDQTGKKNAVIAVSGGIDSAVSLTLLVRALGSDRVFTLLLPYGDQDMTDARSMLEFCQIAKTNRKEINIQPVIDQFASLLVMSGAGKAQYDSDQQKRVGNIMARVRMIMVYDLAAKLDALVCGTENKSEKYLGYFTRFGDQASDLEPIEHLYKTQVRQLAEYLHLPAVLQAKPPSAGLWPDQTDEAELGFSYAQADLVLEKLIDEKIPAEKILLEGVAPDAVRKITSRVKSQAFKQKVPYKPQA